MACPECFTGSLHEGNPRGEVIKLHGLDTYAVEPVEGKTAKGIIVMIPDALGWEFPNCRLLADRYCDKGDFKVYILDFMHGTAAPTWMLDEVGLALGSGNILFHMVKALYGFVPFILQNYTSKSWPTVKSFFEQLRQAEQVLPIGAAGFCWGGKHAVLLAQGAEVDGKPLINVAFSGHPSFLDLPSDVEKITLPMSFAIGDKDNQVPLEKAQDVKAIVEAKEGSDKGEVRIYEDATHGFTLRAALEMENVAQKAAEAEAQAIDWFTKHF
ncbi:hypothetical protein NM208_g5590 [Fusarium decemcellulare]|uniref:Uncharacterized protein n=1 Tax=Fusarium decemcellulare TaxID=57161 RepID=A0ACC1SGD9_9HYPO|nr:hypothetical protein NM208_g5590 [Fusarium decemcellulare]